MLTCSFQQQLPHFERVFLSIDVSVSAFEKSVREVRSTYSATHLATIKSSVM